MATPKLVAMQKQRQTNGKGEDFSEKSAVEIKQEFGLESKHNSCHPDFSNGTNVRSLMGNTAYAGKPLLNSSPGTQGRTPFQFTEPNSKRRKIVEHVEATPVLAASMQHAVVVPLLVASQQVTQDDADDNSVTEIDRLKACLQKFQRDNDELKRTLRDVSTVGVVDESSLYRVRSNTKEHLFKKVKFLISEKTTDDAMAFLVLFMGIEVPKQRDWVNTYLHHVRAAMNNKRNAVAQDLRRELVGTLKRLYPYCLFILQCNNSPLSVTYSSMQGRRHEPVQR